MVQAAALVSPKPRWTERGALPLRLGLALCLLAGERAAGFAFRLDLPALDKQGSWWAFAAGNAGVTLRIGLVAVATAALLLGPRWATIFGALRKDDVGHPWHRWLLAHLAAFAVLLWTTSLVEAQRDSGHVTSGLAAPWLALGLVTIGTWLLVVAPLRFWVRLMRTEWRALLIALAAGVSAWLGGLWVQSGWDSLAQSTLRTAEMILRWVYPEVISQPAAYVLGTPRFSVYVGAPCSGVEGMALVTACLAAYLYVLRSRIRFPQALLLFPIGVSAMWLANALRIALLIAIGSSYSKSVAVVGFHSQAGWIAFTAVALGLVSVTRHLRFFSRVDVQETVASRADPLVAALVVPCLLLLATVMVSSAASDGFDALYPLRPMVVALALWHYRKVYRQWSWDTSWWPLAVGFLVFLVWVALEPAEGDRSLGTALSALPDGQRQVWLAARVFGSVMLVPLVEELAFRGYLLRRLAGSALDGSDALRFTWSSFLVSSLAFGFLHGRWLAGTLAGMAFAFVLQRRNRLGDAVLAHMSANACIAAWVLLGGRWEYW